MDNGRQNLKKRSSSLYKPQKIWYPEDSIREWFFKDHPWELARPRILVENTGNDGKEFNWSQLKQTNKQVDGERYGYHDLLLFGSGRGFEALGNWVEMSY